ncbi:MAG: zinc-ribbon domain-containing protein [Clostridia bacterium]|nr:zinc-ribbon domain-containing protein [Clostridia bacterium]
MITVAEGRKNFRKGATVFYNRLKGGNNYFPNLEWAIRQTFTEFLHTDPPDIDLERDAIRIYEQYMDVELENSIAKKRPNLIEEWNCAKNGDLRPEAISYGSQKKVWWICKHGHEWQSGPWSRYCGSGCPYCAGRLPISGETDLVTLYPDLVKEWHPTKNAPLTPEQITKGSHKKVWWKCANGHEWQATVKSRTLGGCGCPECAKKKQKE